MKYKPFILLLSITIITFSCRKPCSEEPIGAAPLGNYNIEWQITTNMWGDAVGAEWDSDSIFFFNENNEEIPYEWMGGPGTGDSYRSAPFYFYEYPEDDISYEQLVEKTYYFEFHNFLGLDRDTLIIKFRAKEVTCGQILEPLESYFNGEKLDALVSGNKRIIKIFK